MKRPTLPLGLLLLCSCAPTIAARNSGAGGGGGGGPESTPQVEEYVGKKNPALPADAPVAILFGPAPSDRPAGDLGTVRVTCQNGCSYGAASAALIQQARAIGANGVHDVRDYSEKVKDPMETVQAQNERVYNLAGTAFAYSP